MVETSFTSAETLGQCHERVAEAPLRRHWYAFVNRAHVTAFGVLTDSPHSSNAPDGLKARYVVGRRPDSERRAHHSQH